ncbi:hypothetical protein [Undibacterium sp. KW1]|nr:hypothetical protein [Undibacterium sp. KW1]
MHPIPTWTEQIKAAAVTGLIVFAACVLGYSAAPWDILRHYGQPMPS